MDVFSNIKNVTQKAQNLDNITTQNSTKHAQIEKVNKLSSEQQNILDKQDTEKLKKELQKLTEELNKALNPLNTTLKFQFNDKIEELMVKVVDTKDNRVIREYPPKEALELMEKMREIVGLLFDKKG
ncbi:polar flagellin [Nautilia profundicola AmH]|uniref:Polar flagellin n=1 Tax=Nautilia profundicola (strain ATCC BAA-1463 / DSM 18972 / AmH) TaxID=598659 RepID=B9L8E6_NAUPA|nr:flagellar protein FlaG [Nautilia profundicola]ACM93133.1 polar flagellin [Nautilia profundicola AmH]